MRLLLKSEELLQFLTIIAICVYMQAQWYWYLLLFIGPDISMIGYLFGIRFGAWLYNIFHHKGIGIALAFSGFYFDLETLSLIGVILFGHASMDRIFGYGLKYEKGFRFTHLGEIGNS